jgi:hypothetical protein
MAGLLGAGTLTAQVIWTGAGTNAANTNWSYSANWTATLNATANVLFTNSGAFPIVSNINNIVDVNSTILSLQYANTNNFHTTLINPASRLRFPTRPRRICCLSARARIKAPIKL